VVLCLVVVVVSYRYMVVLMRGWAVMVLRVIVPEILVHMQRRLRGRREDQGLNNRACDEATHRDQSTMTAAVAARIAAWYPEGGQLLKPVRSSPSHLRRSPSCSITPSASTIH
jgi:hypothetical protein